jgi:integrase
MAKVSKRVGSGGKFTWYLRYKDPITGKDIKKPSKAKTKSEAERMLREILQEIDTGDFQEKQAKRDTMFFEICDDFLAYSKAHKRSTRTDDLMIRNLKAGLGNRPAREIMPATIEDYIARRKNALSRYGEKLKPASINRELACLKTIYSRAVMNEKVEKNPMRHIKLLKENNVRDRVLSREELKRLLKAAKPHLRPIIIGAHETGMRSGELFSLDWKQVDLGKGLITLVPEQTKTNDGRKIPISPWLRETLETIDPKKGPVFSFRGQSVQSVKNSFRSACIEAEIDDFRFHDLRHTFVTNMRKAGVQDRVIMAITGHKTMTVFMRYDTVDEQDLLSAVS